MRRNSTNCWYAEFTTGTGMTYMRASPGGWSKSDARWWMDRVRIALHTIFPVEWEGE